MPELTVCPPQGPAVTYRFEQDGVTVGRSRASDLVIRDDSLSRIHAEIRRDAEGFVVVDRESRNGTRLNGRRIAIAERLRPGDRIAIGETTIVFEATVADAIAETDQETRPFDSVRSSGRSAEDDEIVGESPALRRVLDILDRVAPSDLNVLLLGENGTGKELAARRLHRRSQRARRPLVVVNCPALPAGLVEAELFGIEKGVATGVDARPGRIEAAHGSTLFLDEIGDLNLEAQAKLLRFLEERVIERVGGRKAIPLDVRVVAATHHDLAQDVARNTFRRDLYHRLKTVTVTLPALRDRREDIPLLSAWLLARDGGPKVALAPEAEALLARYSFPGNVRELEHLLDAASVLARGGVIRPEDLPDEVRAEGALANAASAEPGGGLDAVADRILARIVTGGESFWDAVQKPFLARTLSRDEARAFVARARTEAGGSYKEMAKLLRLESEYKKMINFIDYHQLGGTRHGDGD